MDLAVGKYFVGRAFNQEISSVIFSIFEHYYLNFNCEMRALKVQFDYSAFYSKKRKEFIKELHDCFYVINKFLWSAGLEFCPIVPVKIFVNEGSSEQKLELFLFH